MSVILLSIASYTFASIPAQTMWLDVWINITTGLPILGSTDNSLSIDGAYLSDSPRLTSTELNENRAPFDGIEFFCIMVFSAEYLLRLFASPQGPGVVRFLLPWRAGLWNLVDLIAIAPWYIEKILQLLQLNGNLSYLSVLRLFRLTRITRIFKMSKNLEGLVMLTSALRKSGPALVMLFAFMGIAGVLFATLIFTSEEGTYDPHRRQYVRVDGSPSPFESIPASLWWTIVTMTTVGYGDQVPVTPIGKVIAVLTMFCGLIVLSLPITIIGANFDDEYRELRKREQDRKERARRNQRRTLMAQQQQQQAKMTASGSVEGAPQRVGVKGDPTEPSSGHAAPLETGGAEGGGGGQQGSEGDPIKLIQAMIHEAHYELTMEIDKLMTEHENRLRHQIKQVLRRHVAGADLRVTPLEQMRSQAQEVVGEQEEQG